MGLTTRRAAVTGFALSMLALAGARPAEAQQKIVVYTVIPEQEINREITREFTRRTGIEVELLNVPAAGALSARVRGEKGRPRADILADAPIDFQEALAKDGLLETYKSPLETPEVIAKGYSDPKGYWHGWYGLTTAIFWNRDRFADLTSKAGAATPKSWDDLLSPAFKGEIVVSNPQTSAIGYVVLATQIFRAGEQKGWDYLRRLDANIKQYPPSAPVTVAMVEQGEAAMGVFWLSNVLYSKLGRKQPLDFVVPDDNSVNVWAASIVKGGPNPEGARKYIDFLLSEYPQEVNARIGFRTPLNPAVKPPEGAPALSEIKTVKYDQDWASEHMERIRKEWGRITSK